MEDKLEIKEYLDVNGKATVEFITPKTKIPLLVHKTEDGFSLYGIKWKNGKELPKALTGRYTRLNLAVEAVTDYIADMKETKAVQTELKFKENRPKKA